VLDEVTLGAPRVEGGTTALMPVLSPPMKCETCRHQTRKADYADLGADHFDRRDKVKVAKRLIKGLQDLGITVEVKAAA
jgi:hypothetical protein